MRIPAIIALTLFRNVTSSETGTFTLKGGRPGSYSIFAWENVPSTAWQNAEFLAKYEGRGRPVDVSARSLVKVQPRLSPQ